LVFWYFFGLTLVFWFVDGAGPRQTRKPQRDRKNSDFEGGNQGR